MCGIVGFHGTSSASYETYQALLLLQHRGQDSAGILTFAEEEKKFIQHKALGYVSQVFQEQLIVKLKGSISIGHTRYSTIGDVKEADLQPLVFTHPMGLALVQNGNLSNYHQLKKELLKENRSFQTDNDLEIILHLMAESLGKNSFSLPNEGLFQELCQAIKNVFARVEGGYSVVGIFGERGLFGYRDPHGIRPLLFGSKRQLNGDMTYGFASESCALTFLGYENIRDVAPGEVVFVQGGEVQHKIIQKSQHLPCYFEWVYFSSADSTLENQSVYEARVKLGHALANKIIARKMMNDFDVVVPVPDTSRSTAIGVAEALNIPYREGLIKNRYVQRSFIQNGQSNRNITVNLKFSVVESQVQGKRILLVDDSIVRGTTSKKLITLLKKFGATSVTLASSSPPIKNPCFYGIDFSTYEELISAFKSESELAREIGAKDVIFTDSEDLKIALNRNHFCQSCLTGDYLFSHKDILEKMKSGEDFYV